MGPQGQQLEAPKNVNLQFLDDTWERLLNAMERLEQVTEGFRALTATRLDRHADRDAISEDEIAVRTEVHLQIMCLQRVVHPIRSEGQWMIEDFLAISMSGETWVQACNGWHSWIPISPLILLRRMTTRLRSSGMNSSRTPCDQLTRYKGDESVEFA